MLIPTMVPSPASSSAASTSIGASDRHGAHPVHQTFTTTTEPRRSARSSRSPVRVSPETSTGSSRSASSICTTTLSPAT
jgi:hypothetical protein